MVNITWQYLDKKAATVRALKDYSAMEYIINSSDLEIKDIEDSMVYISSSVISNTPKSKNKNQLEDRIIKSVDKIDILKERYRLAIEYMRWFKPAFNQLSEDELFVLKTFYLDETLVSSPVYKVCEHFSIERSSAYNKKNKALEKLSLLLYGK